MAEAEIGPNLASILNQILVLNHNELMEGINKLMSAQSEFDAKVDRIEAAVMSEKAQIEAFIAANPGLDTSRLDAVVTNIEAIFTAPATEPVPEPPAPEEPPAEEPA